MKTLIGHLLELCLAAPRLEPDDGLRGGLAEGRRSRGVQKGFGVCTPGGVPAEEGRMRRAGAHGLVDDTPVGGAVPEGA